MPDFPVIVLPCQKSISFFFCNARSLCQITIYFQGHQWDIEKGFGNPEENRDLWVTSCSLIQLGELHLLQVSEIPITPFFFFLAVMHIHIYTYEGMYTLAVLLVLFCMLLMILAVVTSDLPSCTLIPSVSWLSKKTVLEQIHVVAKVLYCQTSSLTADSTKYVVVVYSAKVTADHENEVNDLLCIDRQIMIVKWWNVYQVFFCWSFEKHLLWLCSWKQFLNYTLFIFVASLIVLIIFNRFFFPHDYSFWGALCIRNVIVFLCVWSIIPLTEAHPECWAGQHPWHGSLR